LHFFVDFCTDNRRFRDVMMLKIVLVLFIAGVASSTLPLQNRVLSAGSLFCRVKRSLVFQCYFVQSVVTACCGTHKLDAVQLQLDPAQGDCLSGETWRHRGFGSSWNNSTNYPIKVGCVGEKSVSGENFLLLTSHLRLQHCVVDCCGIYITL